MSATASFASVDWSRPLRFAKTPKGIALGILLVLVIDAIAYVGLGVALPNPVACVAVAALLDLAIVKSLRGRWLFPDGAILTGLIVAMVLRPQEDLFVAATISAAAIVGKHAVRTRWSNVSIPPHSPSSPAPWCSTPARAGGVPCRTPESSAWRSWDWGEP